VKVSCTVWRRGKDGDYFKVLKVQFNTRLKSKNTSGIISLRETKSALIHPLRECARNFSKKFIKPSSVK